MQRGCRARLERPIWIFWLQEELMLWGTKRFQFKPNVPSAEGGEKKKSANETTHRFHCNYSTNSEKRKSEGR